MAGYDEYVDTSREEWSHAYHLGYRAGFDAGRRMGDISGAGIADIVAASTRETSRAMGKPKRRQTATQKLLETMSQKKWATYKRTTKKGKKTYFDIRAEVSRSQAYKKAKKRLN